MAGRAGMRWRRLAWLAAPAAAGAKVLDAAPAGFTVADTRSVPVPPERAWQAPVAEADRAMAQHLGGLADYLGRPWPRARLSAARKAQNGTPASAHQREASSSTPISVSSSFGRPACRLARPSRASR
jgi:hypothetical protein